MTVTDVKRVKPDEVELHITLKNEADHDIYLPTYGTGGSLATQIRGVTVYQREADKQWRPLGSGSELSPDAAMRLGPGQTYSFVRWLNDPTVTPRSGEGIPVFEGEPVALRGKHKITVRYYGSKTEWVAYRNYVESFGRKVPERKKPSRPPRLKFAESDEFDIPPAKP